VSDIFHFKNSARDPGDKLSSENIAHSPPFYCPSYILIMVEILGSDLGKQTICVLSLSLKAVVISTPQVVTSTANCIFSRSDFSF
jgi:hypothetical protein